MNSMNYSNNGRLQINLNMTLNNLFSLSFLLHDKFDGENGNLWATFDQGNNIKAIIQKILPVEL